MKCYLGTIELRGTYYNFVPQFEYKPNEVNPISPEDQFPIYGSFNLAYKKHKDSENFLLKMQVDDINYDSESCKCLFAIYANDEDFEDNDDEKIKIKLDLQKICDSGISLNDRIKPISEFKIYKIVSSQSEINDDSFNANIQINESYCDVDELVLFEYKNGVCGPFCVCERAIDGMKYISPDISSNKYLMDFYSFEDKNCQKVEFKRQSYGYNNVSTSVCAITGEPYKMDLINDAVLLNKLQDKVIVELFKGNYNEFERLYNNSPFMSEDIPDEIKRARLSRIKTILKSAKTYNEEKYNAIITTINDSETGDIEKLIENKIINSKKYKEIQDENRKLSQEIDDLIQQKNDSKDAMLNDTFSSEKIQKLNEEKQKLMEEVKDLKNKLSEISDLENKEEKLRKIKEEYDRKVVEISDKAKELKEVKENFAKEIKTDTNQMLHDAFDPYLSNAMIEAASQYSQDQELERYENIAKSNIEIDVASCERDVLIDRIVGTVQKFRHYSKNEILNMYICISQNFLTIFSGEPGTGKTSICNIIAKSMGLDSFGSENEISKNRYIPVSVERGWSSKRDLIGYFNPLTKKYDRTNAKIYDALMILNFERDESKLPYIVLLDEANLSPMEYYWADFMRAADNYNENISINIGLEEDIYIPKTLRFLATINNDQTTEQLSPRLVDRAWIIKLPKSKLSDNNQNAEDYCKNEDFKCLWKDIENTFLYTDNTEIELQSVIEKIYQLFENHHLMISPRIQQSIKRYICIAQKIMEDEGEIRKREKALDFAIIQKLLPKINGYYANYERLFEELKQICVENNLQMTKSALNDLKEFSDQNMGYCQYLV